MVGHSHADGLRNGERCAGLILAGYRNADACACFEIERGILFQTQGVASNLEPSVRNGISVAGVGSARSIRIANRQCTKRYGWPGGSGCNAVAFGNACDQGRPIKAGRRFIDIFDANGDCRLRLIEPNSARIVACDDRIGLRRLTSFEVQRSIDRYLACRRVNRITAIV